MTTPTPTLPTYVPSIPADGGRVMAGWDPTDNRFHPLNLDYIRQMAALAERLHALDRLDDRDKVEATITSGSSVGATATKDLEVPTGEVWFINRLVLVSPAESGVGVGDIVQVNVRVSKWPKTDDVAKSYWSANRGTAAENSYTIDLPAQGELGEELRLEAGDKLTLVAALTGAAAGADLTASLTPYGRKGKKIMD